MEAVYGDPGGKSHREQSVPSEQFKAPGVFTQRIDKNLKM